MSVADRVLQAVIDALVERGAALEGCTGGSSVVTIAVILDAAGVPKKTVFRTESTRLIERRGSV